MPKYVIERELPGAGSLTAEQLKGVSKTSCGVLSTMRTQIQWVHSYVTDNKVFCVQCAQPRNDPRACRTNWDSCKFGQQGGHNHRSDNN